MKVVLLAAALFVPALPAFAAPAAAPAASLTQETLTQDIDQFKATWLRDVLPPDPAVARYSPRLQELKDRVQASADPKELAARRREFHDVKEAVLREKYGEARANGLTKVSFAQWESAAAREAEFRAAAAASIRQRAAQQRFELGLLAWRSQLTGDSRAFFDRAGLHPGDAALTVPQAAGINVAPRAAAPARANPAAYFPVPSAPDAPAATSPSAFSRFIAGVASVPRAWARKASEYATQVSDAIFNYAAGVQKSLLAGLIQAESGFNSVVGSWAGCLGLGQLSDGVAKAYHVRDRTSIDQNVRGSAGFLRDLQKQFSSPEESKRLQELFVEAAADYDRRLPMLGPNPSERAKQKLLHSAFQQIYGRIPNGIENSLAAYNAGPGAVSAYHGWRRLPLPRGGCVNRPAQDNSYCQTMAYVPRVLENSFGVYVNTRQAAPRTDLLSL